MWPFRTVKKTSDVPPSLHEELCENIERARSNTRAIRELEADVDSWKTQLRALRGQLTGGLRKPSEDESVTDINAAIKSGTYGT